MEINAISKTAFFCAGVRADDARSKQSLCSDIYADDFMTDEGRAIFSMFSKSPKQNISNVVRSRVIQDELARHLKQNKNLQVINIGAGFDSRAFRLAGGHWLEFDEPAIIQHKENRLPATHCPNPLKRIAVDFGKGELADALHQSDASAETLIIIEGVFMYLEPEDVIAVIKTLQSHFPRHLLICDLMDRTFFEKHMGTSYDRVLQLGSQYRFIHENPGHVFTSNGYALVSTPISVVERARDFGAFFLPRWLLNRFFTSLRDGYRIHTFMTKS